MTHTSLNPLYLITSFMSASVHMYMYNCYSVHVIPLLILLHGCGCEAIASIYVHCTISHTHIYIHTCSETLGSNDNPHECWVTVFGFPSSASSYVLEQFSQYGTILRHSVSYWSWWQGSVDLIIHVYEFVFGTQFNISCYQLAYMLYKQ